MSKRASRVQVGQQYFGGLEGWLDVIGGLFFLLAALLAGLIAVATNFEWWWVGLILLFEALVAWTFTRVMAEIVRLQKKIAGLPYGGQISQNTSDAAYGCGECGAPIYHPYRCHKCGCQLVSDQELADELASIDTADNPDA